MTTVVKIGGHVLADEAALDRFCHDFVSLKGSKILVHGGGELASEVQAALGAPPVKIEGRRVTDAAALQAVTMVYAGWYNKLVVAKLQREGCNAVGLSGADASCITARRRPPRTISDGSTVDYGFVGDVGPGSVDARFLTTLLDRGYTPVLCAINHDGRGQLLNTNADTVATSVAAAMGASLICCFELPGVLADPSDPSSLIREIDSARFEELKSSGIVSGGMLPKLESAFAALRCGAAGVTIKKATELLGSAGTVIRL